MSIRPQATGEQIAHLLDYLAQHKDLARGSLRGPDARIRAKSMWEEISTTLNSLGGAIKTAVQWQKGDENQPPDSPMVVEDFEVVEEEVVTDHDYFNVAHCSSQPPQPLTRTPLAPVNSSTTQPSDPLTRTPAPLAPANSSTTQPSDPLTRTPLAPANSSTRRRIRNNRGRAAMQPNVARRILDAEGQKLAVMVEMKNTLVGVLNQLVILNNSLVDIAQAIKDK